MPEVGNVRWALVAVDEGNGWDVLDERDDGTPGTRRFGTVRFTDHGWVAEDGAGETYGPFTTLDEAAYPLALRASGDEADATLLLGPGHGNGAAAELPPGTPGALRPGRRFSPPPARLLVWLVIGLALTVGPRVLQRRGARRSAPVPAPVRPTGRRRPA